MKQFMDIFSLPEMSLLSCVNEYFLKNNIDYEPVHLYKDVKVVWAAGGPGSHPWRFLSELAESWGCCVGQVPEVAFAWERLYLWFVPESCKMFP